MAMELNSSTRSNLIYCIHLYLFQCVYVRTYKMRVTSPNISLPQVEKVVKFECDYIIEKDTVFENISLFSNART